MDANSPTDLVRRLKAGDHDAVLPLWNGYFRRLVALARHRLGTTKRRVADEEDVALSAFHSFVRGVSEDRFRELEDREDLWQILSMLVVRKACRQIERQRAAKRGSDAVRGDSAFRSNPDDATAAFAEIAAEGPTPEVEAAAREEFDRLVDALPDDVHRTVALMKLDGHSNEEVAREIDRDVRTVERKLKSIRECWSRLSPDDEVPGG